MADSDDLSSAADIPADAEIETCLRDVVREAVRKEEEVTVKLARSRAEDRLGLGADFFKINEHWKQRSKDLISAAFDEPLSPEALKKTAPAPAPKPKPKPKPPAKAGTKRKSDETQPKKKRQKTNSVSGSNAEKNVIVNASDDSAAEDADKSIEQKQPPRATSEKDSALSEPPQDVEEPDTVKKNGSAAINDSDEESELSSVIDDPPPKKKRQKKAAPASREPSKPSKTSKASPPVEDDESDLSSVIDDAPPKKPRKKKPTSPAQASNPKMKATAAAAAAGKNLSPDEEEIKRLQSWLLKCGIRKLWHRELAPFATNREKIGHLKSMLEAAGMTGRFSAEKARQIKEARELEAELEEAKAFNKTWGHEGDGSGDEDEDDEVEKDGKGEEGQEEEDEEEQKRATGRRARPKGFVDFGDSDEDSE